MLLFTRVLHNQLETFLRHSRHSQVGLHRKAAVTPGIESETFVRHSQDTLKSLSSQLCVLHLFFGTELEADLSRL